MELLQSSAEPSGPTCPAPPKDRRTTPADLKTTVWHGAPGRVELDPIVIETTGDTVDWDCSDLANYPPKEVPKPTSVTYRIQFTDGPPPFDPAGLGPFRGILAKGSHLQGTGNTGQRGCFNYEVHATFFDAFHANGVDVRVDTTVDPQIDNLPPIPPHAPHEPHPEPPPRRRKRHRS
jgi:hypothetical protein